MPFRVEGGKQQAAKKSQEFLALSQRKYKEKSMGHQSTDDERKKIKVAKLLALLTKVTGKVFNKNTISNR